MSDLIFDLIITSLVLLGLTVVCSVWGRATFRLLGVPSEQHADCAQLWLGFAIILAVIEFLHLFMPVDSKMGVLLLGLALLPVVFRPRRLEPAINVQTLLRDFKQHYFKILLILIIALIWCLRAMGVSNNFDSGLYHFGSIRWLNEYPIIPGLGNLHWRLALNQSYFGFLSLINIFPFWNKGYAAGGLFLIYLVGLTLIEIGSTQRAAWRWLVGGALFIFLGYLAGTLPNPSPDTAVSLLEIVIFGFLFRLIKNHKTDSIDLLRDSVVTLTLCLALITIKLSSIAFATTCGILVLYLQFSRLSQTHSVYLRLMLLIGFISSVHLVRGYLLSGAPFFPSTFAGAWQLDWAVPIELINFEVALIYSWARLPGELSPAQVLGQWDWISEWFAKISWLDRIVFGSATILMLVNFFLCLNKKTLENHRQYLWMYSPLVSALIFWFLTAPDIRFLGAVPALYFSLSIWMFYVLMANQYSELFLIKKLQNRFFYGLGAVVICLVSFKLTGLRAVSLHGWSAIPQYPVDVQKTHTGLLVNVSTMHGQCWDASLPCASIFNANLYANPLNMPWPLSLLGNNRFFYSVKFLNLPK